MTKPDDILDCAVVGAGPAGLAAAAALAISGARVALAGTLPPDSAERPDRRTAALFAPSIRLLERVGAWPALADVSAPITGIRLIDAMGGLLRAPETLFLARELGLEAFGHNIPNPALVAALRAAAGSQGGTELLIGEAVAAVEPGPEHATVRLASGRSLVARLVVAADGRGSLARQAAGIAAERWDYPQIALTAHITHSRPHAGISSELHRPCGPLTVVPLPGTRSSLAHRSSLVWVEPPVIARRLQAMPPEAFRDALERHLGGLLGSIDEVSPPVAFPLGGLRAERLAANRVALIGEAAHVFPPIGAQGLNLSMRDVATLADTVGDTLAEGGDPGSHGALTAFARARRADVASRTSAVDLLNRSLLADSLPVNLARGLGLHVIGAIGPLRQLVMRLGMGGA